METLSKQKMESILESVISYVALAENTNGQLATLFGMGFDTEALEYFGYSKHDIEAYLQEND